MPTYLTQFSQLHAPNKPKTGFWFKIFWQIYVYFIYFLWLFLITLSKYHEYWLLPLCRSILHTAAGPLSILKMRLMLDQVNRREQVVTLEHFEGVRSDWNPHSTQNASFFRLYNKELTQRNISETSQPFTRSAKINDISLTEPAAGRFGRMLFFVINYHKTKTSMISS